MKIIILLLSICAGITASVVSISTQANSSAQLILHSVEKHGRSHPNKVIANMGQLTCEIYTKKNVHYNVTKLEEKDISHMHCHNKQQLDERKARINKLAQAERIKKLRIARKDRQVKRLATTS
jgi:hypothetical protein